jgi:hypothetical protein
MSLRPTTHHLNGLYVYLPRVIKKEKKIVHRDKALPKHRAVQKMSKEVQRDKKDSA